MPGKEANPKDTVKVYYLDEVVVTSSVKETNELKNMPTAVSVVSPKQLRDTQIESLPGLSAYIPNFFLFRYMAQSPPLQSISGGVSAQGWERRR